MSRSRKREAVYKDPSNTQGKKIANRKLRRAVKQAIHNGDDHMPLIDEVMNQYDLIDFKSRVKIFEDDYEKTKRK